MTVAHVGKALDDAATTALDRIVARLTPTLRARFLEAVQQAQAAIDLERVAANLAEGHITTAEALTRLDVFQNQLNGLLTPLKQGFLLGAELAANGLAAQGIRVSLDLVNPRAVAWVNQNGGALITGVTEETRQAVRTVLTQAFTEGIAPREMARLIKPIVGLSERQGRAVAAFRARLVDEAVPVDQIEARVDRVAAVYARQRGELIARTETLTASNQGQGALWKEAQDQRLIPRDTKRVWMTADDDRVDPECETLDGTEAGLEEPFKGGTMGPPLHPQCRCTTSLRFS